MGYAETFPFSFNSTYETATAFTTFISLSTIATDKAICSIKTMDYTKPLTYAFAEIQTEATRDTSGALNNFDVTGGGYLELDDGTSTKNAGFIYDKHFITNANGMQGFNRFMLRENLNAYLQPDTEYTCTIKLAQCLGNNLFIYHPKVNINLFGNV